MEKKTLRLIYPEWHGGVNPNSVFGSKLLSCIAPPSETDETVEIEVKTDFDSPVAQVNGIVGLSITEHLPWDAFNLRKMLSEISIFKS